MKTDEKDRVQTTDEQNATSTNEEEKVSQFEQKFREIASASNIEYVDDALKLADLSNVYFEDDEMHGIEEVVKELAENKPFLLKKKPTVIGRPAGRGYEDDDRGDLALLADYEAKAKRSGKMSDRVVYAQMKRKINNYN